MAIFNFSALANGQHLAFDRELDTLAFDSTAITASAVKLSFSGTNLGLTVGTKTVWLDAVDGVGGLYLENIQFANGSYLIFGDGTASRFHDAYGQQYTLESSTAGSQVWGLGGADYVGAGSGNDWMVGNVALSPLTHVSRSGSTGSPLSSTHAGVSADGRYVVFDGDWSSFGVTNSGEGIIVKDMTTGSFSNEHRTYTGAQGGSGAAAAVISADGNVVAFHAAQSGLVPGANSGALYDIYATDAHGSGIERVSTGTNGTLALDGRSLNPDLSGTGQFVVFESSTSNFAAGGSTQFTDVFLKDRDSDTTTRLSTSTAGTDGNGESVRARVSADGDYVVFQSDASNLTTGDTNGRTDIFLWDRAANKLVNLTQPLVAVSSPANGNYAPDVAYHGDENAVVVFQTGRNLLAADTSNGTDIYAYYFKEADASKRLKLVSSTSDGKGVALSSEDASISCDGRWVVFTSYSDALVAGDSNGTRDIFVKDLYTGAIALVSKTSTGVAGNGPSSHAQISSGGDWIVFESSASNLASTDANGGFSDVFRVANPLLADTLVGGAGHDTYVINRNDVIVENVNGGSDLVQASLSYTLGANLENLTLTGTANLSGTGNALNNVITGNAGNNLLNGGGGTDTASYANATAAVTVNLSTVGAQATGFGSDSLVSIENLIGSALNDRLTGNGGANRLDGGAGNDTLTGGEGSDTYVVDSSFDVITETGVTAGNVDTVFSSVGWTLGTTLENLTLTGTAAVRGDGNGNANVLVGNAAANTMDGSGGNDTISGGAGNDSLVGGAGNDRLDGNTGSDTLIGGDGSDTYVVDSSFDVISEAGTTAGNVDTVLSAVTWTLGSTLENLTLTGTTVVSGTGNNGANVLTGNGIANLLSGAGGNDTLYGGAGNDTLTGGAGSDRLSGSSGNDTFVLTSLVGSDTVVDFLSGSDKLRISQAPIRIGDGDLAVEGAVTRSAPGGFSSSAELVVFGTNAAALTTTAAAATIGAATTAFSVGRTALYAIDDGSSTAVFLFTAADANATVSAAELTLLATLSGTPSTAVADYLFGA